MANANSEKKVYLSLLLTNLVIVRFGIAKLKREFDFQRSLDDFWLATIFKQLQSIVMEMKIELGILFMSAQTPKGKGKYKPNR